ncbi:hypothetical protein E4U42_000601 [Claviceps africana]|uniref:Telomere-associated protein Rif1 N-terminal domain-containing protein n=1 Tax=Claviceps africana TaxID=83212 RepID=A0A8K0JAN4_9HYPO|nr:hypothetical protein E4U42_000601 [Claviceps africana]
MASSVASASSTSILESLPARPPTPPREALHDTDIALKSSVCPSSSFDPTRSLQTPPNANSPTFAAATDSDPGSGRVRKKVEWSAHTDYREAPHFHHAFKPIRSSPLSAPSSASSKPVKSILKSTSSSSQLASSLGNETDGSASPPNIIEMLDSSIKQLAGSNRDSKLDAYMMLSRALKASNNLPDRVALQNKMSLFMQFIQRDMTAKTSVGGLDSSLINHSLTLLATFLHFPAIASTLTTDFGVFVMEHSIRSFADEASPKDVVRHLMQVVAFQNFSPKVVTSDRVGRLVSAVHNIETYIKGKSIVMSRLHIYKRLIKQSRTHMATHCDWLKDMFTDMLNTVKDIRSQAISLGTEAGFTLRSEKQLVRKVAEIFQTTTDSETYIDFYIKRLQDMIKDRQTCAAVPQIWSVVILFLRYPLDRWHYYGPWLTLVQSAFNMTDSLTKQEANFAWNRYVYLTVSDSKANPKTISTLCQPLLSQLRRRTNPKQREEATKLRRVVIGGVCNLYYYTFAPRGDTCLPDIIWDVAVKPVIKQLSSLDDNPEVLGDGVVQAARLLMNLLDVSTPRIWRHDRIMDPAPVQPDELPAIDSKWIRKNCDKVLDCVGPILRQRFCDLAHKDSLAWRLWQVLVTSVAVASAKDIKVSDETANFVGCAFGILSEVVMAAAAEADASSLDSKFLPSLSNYIQLLIDGLGILPFTEKRLSMTVPNTFKPVSTPSHRPGPMETPGGVIRMPLHHLFVMLSAIPTNHANHDSSMGFFHLVFGPFLKKKTAKSRLGLSKELLHLIPRNTQSPAGPWLFTADCAKAFLEAQSPTAVASSSTEQMLGPDYREIVSLLERGLTSHSNMTATAWLSLLQAVATRITGDFGDAGCCLVVVEPLAKALYDFVTSSEDRVGPLTVEAVIALVRLTKFPRDKQAWEAARSRLWGNPKSATKATPVPSLAALYKLTNHFLSYLYHHNDGPCLNTSLFMETILGFLDKNWTVCGLTPAFNLHSGLDKWIQDGDAILASSCHSSLPSIVASIWDHICSHIVMHCQAKDVNMSQIETLLISGFKSRCPSIVHRTALAWNAIVKNDEDVTCSDVLKSAMSSAPSTAALFLHGDAGDSDGPGAQAPSLIQPGTGSAVVDSRLLTSERTAGSVMDTPVASSSRRSLGRKRRMETPPETARDKPTKRTNTSRLRHDNSQLQFEPITASSPPQEESQHLTEHQKEVRERQRSNTTLYSNASSTSPPATVNVPSRRNRADDASESDKQAQDTTPKQNKTFEDLLCSTPTPRRGNFLQMDDLNDPPSSPPIPRPYPLLSEIQSRSRTGPMENWEFSSPPGSPTENQYEQAEGAELLSAASTEEPSPVKSMRSSKKQQRAKDKTRERSVEAVFDEETEKGRTKSAPDARVHQAKPFEGAMTRARKAHETPTTEDVAFTKAQPVSKRCSSRQWKLRRRSAEPATSPVGSSLDAASEAEAGLSAQSTTESLLAKTVAGSAVKPIKPHECIMVHTDSSGASAESSKDSVSIVPSTPAETAQSPITSGPRRKRKREAKSGGGGGGAVNKKRCSNVHELTESPALKVEPTSSPVSVREIAPAPATGVETRSGLRKRQHLGGSHEKEPAGSDCKRQSAVLGKTTEEGDTDEEVQSQLVTESHAASQQSQSRQGSVEAGYESFATEPAEAATDVDIVSRRNGNEAQPRRPVKSNAEKALSLLTSLRNGLEQLRGVSLTRDKVYEVEDILMDMKRELFEAERRGRVQPRPAKQRRRSSRKR